MLDNFTPNMNEMKANTCTNLKNFLCVWTDKKNYLIQYRMFKFYVRDGMIVDKVHEIISFGRSKWSEKYQKFIIHKK